MRVQVLCFSLDDVEEREVVSFDDWGGGRGKFDDGIASVCDRGEEEAPFHCRLEGGFEREQRESF